MQNYSNYAIQRGLESEAAVREALQELTGKPIIPASRKCRGIIGKIIGFFSAKPNDVMDNYHADFEVEVTSDINGGKITLPLQAKSSLTGKNVFERKCAKCGWGPIQVVLVESSDLVQDGDNASTIFKKKQGMLQKVKDALVRGYNIFRRLIIEKVHAITGRKWDGPRVKWTELTGDNFVERIQAKPQLKQRYFNLSRLRQRGGYQLRCA
jgi:hypothetical protein